MELFWAARRSGGWSSFQKGKSDYASPLSDSFDFFTGPVRGPPMPEGLGLSNVILNDKTTWKQQLLLWPEHSATHSGFCRVFCLEETHIRKASGHLKQNYDFLFSENAALFPWMLEESNKKQQHLCSQLLPLYACSVRLKSYYRNCPGPPVANLSKVNPQTVELRRFSLLEHYIHAYFAGWLFSSTGKIFYKDIQFLPTVIFIC